MYTHVRISTGTAERKISYFVDNLVGIEPARASLLHSIA